MPYHLCPSCGSTSYSAATQTSVGTCPTCSDPFTYGEVGALAPALRRSLPACPTAAVRARRALLTLAVPEPTRDSLRLVVSELVMNAVRHGRARRRRSRALGAPIDLSVSQVNGKVRVAVRDRGPGFEPRIVPQAPPEGGGGGGLGFVIVDALANDWGVEREPDGCTVWCTLEAQAS